MNYGELIQKARKKIGTSQKELGKAIGVSQQLIGAWEKEQRRISLYDADKVFSALGISVTIGLSKSLDDMEVENENPTLPRANKWMFQTVRCKAYMKKVNDGRYIRHYAKNETMSGKEEFYYCDKNGELEIPDEDCGGSDFIKTYYERKETDFAGVVVGMKEIIVTAMLYLDHNDNPHGGDYDFVAKHPLKKAKCAHVFFGMNRSRYVPLDDMEVVNENRG